MQSNKIVLNGMLHTESYCTFVMPLTFLCITCEASTVRTLEKNNIRTMLKSHS